MLRPDSPDRTAGPRTLLLAYWTLMCFGTHAPRYGPIGLATVAGWDKLVHFVAYAGLALLMRRATVPVPGRGWAILVLCAAYGAVDELTQPLFNRTADPFDWLADTAGVLAVCVLWRVLRVAKGWRKPVPASLVLTPFDDIRYEPTTAAA